MIGMSTRSSYLYQRPCCFFTGGFIIPCSFVLLQVLALIQLSGNAEHNWTNSCVQPALRG